MNQKFKYLITFITNSIILIMILTSCSEIQAEAEEKRIVSQGADPSHTPKLLYQTPIDHLTPFNETSSLYSVYEIKLPSGKLERRGLISIDSKIHYLGPLVQSFPDIDIEFTFFKIQEGQFMGVYLGETYADRVDTVLLYRERTEKSPVWAVGADITINRSGLTDFKTYNTSFTTQWQDVNQITLIYSDHSPSEDFEFSPPANISDFFVDISYSKSINYERESSFR